MTKCGQRGKARSGDVGGETGHAGGEKIEEAELRLLLHRFGQRGGGDIAGQLGQVGGKGSGMGHVSAIAVTEEPPSD